MQSAEGALVSRFFFFLVRRLALACGASSWAWAWACAARRKWASYLGSGPYVRSF